MSSRLLRVAFAVVVAAGALIVQGPARAQNLSIATGGTGGVYYPLGGGIAAALSKSVPGMALESTAPSPPPIG